MTTYHETPFTLSPYQEIPADAPLSAGMTDADADAVATASAEYAPDDTVEVQVSSAAPFEVDVLLVPATDFAEGFAVQWNFGDGYEFGADDLDQHHVYGAPGAYPITAHVQQPGEATFSLSAAATFDDDGLLFDDEPPV